MTHVLRAELLKLRTTRTALAFAAAGTLIVLLFVLVGILAGKPDTITDKRDAISVGHIVAVLLVLFGVVGATSEYRHRTVAAAALIVPSRLRMSLGRMVAYGLAGLVVGAILLIVAFVIGIPLLSGRSGPALRAGDYAHAAGGGLLACGLGAMLGVAVGVLIANQVAAVVGTLVFLLIAEPLIIAASETVGKFLPGDVLVTIGGQNVKHQLGFGAAVALTLAWTALALGIAVWVDRRRDIT